jgi:hypothetical protein
MYDQTTRSFTLRGPDGSYDWLVENYDPANYQEFTDKEIYDWIDLAIALIKDDDLYHVEMNSREMEFPRYGYSTTHIYQDAEDYCQQKAEEFDADLKEERGLIFTWVKDWINGTL